jgi:phage terminase large subunit-like protein
MARPEQLSPWSPSRGPAARAEALSRWRAWLFCAGRGAGKTRSAAEAITEEAAELGEDARIALVGRTAADVRDVIVEGESGLLAVAPPEFTPKYEPSKRRLTWPNGAQASTYSSDSPDQLRGPQFHVAWCDELAAFENLRDVWTNLGLGLRLGDHPRLIATTTPRPVSLLRDLLRDPTVLVSRSSTWANAAHLPAVFLGDMRRRYAGTTIGRQEIEGEVLGELDGAMFTSGLIARMRVERAPELARVAVFVDPSVSTSDTADATGLLALGVDAAGVLYVLADRSGRLSPDAWARGAIALYWEAGAVDLVIEANQGAELLAIAVRNIDPRVNVRTQHVRGSKAERLVPAVALAEQGRLRIVGDMPELADEAVSWTPTASWSPGRLDALSLAVSELASRPEVPLPAPDEGALDCEPLLSLSAWPERIWDPWAR